ncbi:ABC transporter permease (plasmid) [Enterobacter bugandensis]|uniref:ABC transporter permease n=1 Tax=Enterobacter bugandensis TaxID=881260 RepID=UPI00283AAADE|nr:ABC transporter permease [Enterobacter bugandensis]WMU75515.1 ABC transporter permease [Enterobacter bugandensis]
MAALPNPNSPPINQVLPETLPDYTGTSLRLILSEAFLSLSRQFRRTCLTMLGIIIGTIAVVALLNIGHAASADSLKTFRSMGADILMITLTPAHENQFLNIPLSFNYTTALADIPGLTRIVPVAYGIMTLHYHGRQMQVTLLGTTPDFLDIAGGHIVNGRALSAYDKEAFLTIPGHNVVNTLSTPSWPLSPGAPLSLQGYTFTVAGVAAPVPPAPLLGITMDSSVIISLDVIRRVIPGASVSRLIIQVKDADTITEAAQKLSFKLSKLLPGVNAEVQIPEQLLAGMKHQAALFAWLLGGLGGISLLAGGVGVMNVMLMSVTERRREIGLRMALGARSRDILWLFVAEAGCMSLPGALAGTVIGLGIAFIFSAITGQLFLLYPPSIPLGAGCALLTGILSGLYPAMTAARMQPVQALRND